MVYTYDNNNNDKFIEKPIDQIRKGEIVFAMSTNGSIIQSEVALNVKTTGKFKFIEIKTRNIFG